MAKKEQRKSNLPHLFRIAKSAVEITIIIKCIFVMIATERAYIHTAKLAWWMKINLSNGSAKIVYIPIIMKISTNPTKWKILGEKNNMKTMDLLYQTPIRISDKI